MTNYQKKKHDHDYAHNYHKGRFYCPVCRLYKIKRQCHVHPNLASLSWHLKQEHRSFSCSKFSIENINKVLENISRAIEWGIIDR